MSQFAGLIEILTGQACEQGSNGPFCEIASVETRLGKIVKRVNEIEPKMIFHSPHLHKCIICVLHIRTGGYGNNDANNDDEEDEGDGRGCVKQ